METEHRLLVNVQPRDRIAKPIRGELGGVPYGRIFGHGFGWCGTICLTKRSESTMTTEVYPPSQVSWPAESGICVSVEKDPRV